MTRQKQGEETARTQLRNWVKEYTGGQTELTLGSVTHQALEHFGADTEFINQFFQETLRTTVYDLAQEYLADNRARHIDQVARSIQEGKMPRSGVFASWMEHSGSRHINLMEMTRKDLLDSASERQVRGDHELTIAALWRQMASQMRGQTKVKTKFNEEDIQRMYDRLREPAMMAAD